MATSARFTPGKRYFNWELDDPAEQNTDVLRDDIEARVRILLSELLPADI